MSKRVSVYVWLFLCIIALGPAVSLPALSAHRPVLTAPSSPAHHSPLDSPFAPAAPVAAMAIKVKDASTIAGKWKTRAGAAASDYSAGVAGAGGTFEQNATAAADVYKQTVIEAANKGRYEKGIAGSGAKWQKNAAGLGAQRYPTGVANAQDSYAAGMQPVLATLSSLTLPARGVPGTNQERSNVVAMALRKMKYGA